MRKVFRIWKMLERDLVTYSDDIAISMKFRVVTSILSLRSGWPVMCDGLTFEECATKGYHIPDTWLVEEEDK